MKKKKSELKDVVVKEDILPATVINFEGDAGMGLEGTDLESFAIPYLVVLQKLSPQCDEDTGVVGAKAGLFFNTVTEEMFDELVVIPCAFRRQFVEIDVDGNFKGLHDPTVVDLNADAKYFRDEEGHMRAGDNYLRDTRQHLVLAFNKSSQLSPAIISLSSSQLKKSKRWLSLIKGLLLKNDQGVMYNPPSFSHYYHLTTVPEENSKGKWFGVNITSGQSINNPAEYQMAKEFNKQILKGKVKVADPVAEPSASDDDI